MFYLAKNFLMLRTTFFFFWLILKKNYLAGYGLFFTSYTNEVYSIYMKNFVRVT